jgi:hypothetical protein
MTTERATPSASVVVGGQVTHCSKRETTLTTKTTEESIDRSCEGGDGLCAMIAYTPYALRPYTGLTVVTVVSVVNGESPRNYSLLADHRRDCGSVVGRPFGGQGSFPGGAAVAGGADPESCPAEMKSRIANVGHVD